MSFLSIKNQFLGEKMKNIRNFLQFFPNYFQSFSTSVSLFVHIWSSKEAVSAVEESLVGLVINRISDMNESY